MKVQLVTDKLLVVALSQQRPDRDDRLRNHLYDQIRWYRQRIEAFNPKIGTQRDGLWLYRPVTALLWGTYDQATLFVADDFDAVTQIAPGVGASSREFLTCSPYRIIADNETPSETIWPATPLLNRTSPQPYKYLAIATLRLASPVTSAMGAAETRAAIVRRLIHFMANTNRAATRCFLSAYRCWSGPDLVVVFQTNESALFVDFEEVTRSLSLGVLWSANPLGRLTPEQTLPARLLSTWRFCKRENVVTTVNDETWQKLSTIDAVCHVRIHLGVHGPGWAARASGPLLTAMSSAFSTESVTRAARDKIEGVVRDGFKESMLADAVTTKARATVSLEIKPGHMSLLTKCFFSLTQGKEQSALQRKLEHSVGARPQLRVKVPVSLTEAGFDELFVLSHGIRMLPEFCGHLLAIETRLSISLSQQENDTAMTGKLGAPMNGYRLIEPRNTVDVLHFHRRLIRCRQLPRSQAMALHAVLEHLEEQIAQPHSTDPMIGLHAFAINSVRGILASKPDDVPPDVICALVEAIEVAAQQRAHYDSSPKARVPLSGYLPYGLAQMVSIADGLVSTIFESALVQQAEALEVNESPPTSRTLLLLKPSPAVEICEYAPLRVTTISTSLPNLLSPLLLLTSIFHEAGHACARDVSSSAGPAARAAVATSHGSLEFIGSQNQRTHDDLVEHWTLLLEDTIPNAFVLIVGCGGNFERFEEQFLFSDACGLRHLPDGTRGQKVDQWAMTLTLLLIQHGVFSWFNDEKKKDLRLAVTDAFNIDPQEFIWSHIGWWAPEIAYDDAPLAVDLEEMVVVFEKRHIAIMTVLTVPSVVNVVFWKMVEEELLRIEGFGKNRGGPEKDVYAQVAENIREGKVPTLTGGVPGEVVDWGVVDHRTGRPTTRALTLVREVFLGLQDHHGELILEATGSHTLDRGVSRCRESGAIIGVKATQLASDVAARDLVEPLCGVFADSAGGPFVCGASVRASYLASRVAALETLSCLAGRVSSALLMERFSDQRVYVRHRFRDRQTQFLWKKRPSNTERRYECTLVDICPGTVKVYSNQTMIDEWAIGDVLWIGELTNFHCVFCTDLRTSQKHPFLELVLMLPRTARIHFEKLHQMDDEMNDDTPPIRRYSIRRHSIRRYSRSGGGGTQVTVAGRPCEIEEYSRVGMQVRHSDDWETLPSENQVVIVVLDEGIEISMRVCWVNGSHMGLSRDKEERGLPHIPDILNEREPSPWTSGPIGEGMRSWLSGVGDNQDD